MVGPNYRLLVGTVLSIFVAVGFLIVVGMAYMIRTVEYLQLAVTLPAVLLLSYYWWDKSYLLVALASDLSEVMISLGISLTGCCQSRPAGWCPEAGWRKRRRYYVTCLTLTVCTRNFSEDNIMFSLLTINLLVYVGTILPDDFDLNAEVKVVKNDNSLKELLNAPRLMCRSLIIFLNW
mgnify:FL=1